MSLCKIGMLDLATFMIMFLVSLFVQVSFYILFRHSKK